MVCGNDASMRATTWQGRRPEESMKRMRYNFYSQLQKIPVLHLSCPSRHWALAAPVSLDYYAAIRQIVAASWNYTDIEVTLSVRETFWRDLSPRSLPFASCNRHVKDAGLNCSHHSFLECFQCSFTDCKLRRFQGRYGLNGHTRNLAVWNCMAH